MEKVLIVDNDIDSLDTLERVLRKEFRVFRAGNGFEAIHVLDREGEMALVISELSMPVVDGVEFLMGMMHAYPDTVRVVLTRSLDPDLLLVAVNDLKLFRYMVKPFKREELLLVVHQGVETYEKGELLLHAGRPIEYLMIILEGKFQVYLPEEGNILLQAFDALSKPSLGKTIGIVQEGDLVGETAVLDSRPSDVNIASLDRGLV
jgi:CheY-like chemotaxis protein